MNSAGDPADRGRPYVWTIAVLAAVAPFLLTLCVILWRTPFPVNEAVALFEDVAKRPATDFLIPETSYYRPLFHLTLMGIWRHAGSLGAKLAWVKLLHISPVAVLVVLFVVYLRPRNILEASAAAVASMVLFASPGFRDNLEIPLSYTAMGMPIALMAWSLLNRKATAWSSVAVFALTLIAIGFKEQGLVLIPLAIVAWWTGAAGAGRRLVASLTVLGLVYVAFRLHWRGHWPLFEQSMGLGYSILEPSDALARFGAFPYWMYAYNSASTISNVLFAEPTSGLFYITRNLRYGGLETWEVVNLGSSLSLTALIVWWGVRSLRDTTGRVWSLESRTFVAMVVVLLACGVLSFDYSRDRLGGMVVPFYALAAYFALRTAATQMASVRSARVGVAVAGVAIVLISSGWAIRAAGTLEWTRRTSATNHVGWLTQIASRRVEFADRPVYLQIMDSMSAQGHVADAPRPTRFPLWVARAMGPQ